MNERIKDDYSVRVTIKGTEDSFLVSPKYDHLQTFSWLGWSILRVVLEDGMGHMHLPEDKGIDVAQQAGLPVAPCDSMMKSDYKYYLQAQEQNLEQWFTLGEDNA
jgi:hypothetical protein